MTSLGTYFVVEHNPGIDADEVVSLITTGPKYYDVSKLYSNHNDEGIPWYPHALNNNRVRPLVNRDAGDLVFSAHADLGDDKLIISSNDNVKVCRQEIEVNFQDLPEYKRISTLLRTGLLDGVQVIDLLDDVINRMGWVIDPDLIAIVAQVIEFSASVKSVAEFMLGEGSRRAIWIRDYFGHDDRSKRLLVHKQGGNLVYARNDNLIEMFPPNIFGGNHSLKLKIEEANGFSLSIRIATQEGDEVEYVYDIEQGNFILGNGYVLAEQAALYVIRDIVNPLLRNAKFVLQQTQVQI